MSKAFIKDGLGSCSYYFAYYRLSTREGQGSKGSRERILANNRGGLIDTRRRGWYVFLYYFYCFVLCLLMILLLLGTFLVNFVRALVLFHSGASRSFVLSSFCRGFNIAREALSWPLRISIANDHAVSATDIYRCCVLRIVIFGYPIDLIPIAMEDVFAIMGMEWLSRFGDLIDCEQ